MVVRGLGGAGKTQLALNYIRDHRRDYKAVLWIEASQKASIERDYVELYQLMFPERMTSASPPTSEEAVSAVKGWFHQQNDRTLLVVDSADCIDNTDDEDYIDIRRYLPDAPSVDIILTTRSTLAEEMTPLEPIKVEELALEEATALFRACAKLPSSGTAALEVEQEVRSIVKELGCFALAITLAGSYVVATPRLSSDIRRYLPEYMKQRKQLLSRRANQEIHRYGESVLSTWEASFAAAERRSPLAPQLLGLLACLNCEDIPLALFAAEPPAQEEEAEECERGGEEERQEEKQGEREEQADETDEQQQFREWWSTMLSPGTTVEQSAIDTAFETLHTYSLVSWRPDQRAYTMHKLVHAWGYERLDDGARITSTRIALYVLADASDLYTDDLTMKTRLFPHIMANLERISAYSSMQTTANIFDFSALLSVAGTLDSLARYTQLRDVAQYMCDTAEKQRGAGDKLTLSYNSLLAVAMHKQGQLVQAEKLHRQTVNALISLLGRYHVQTLASIGSLADTLQDRGDFVGAENIYRQNWEMQKDILGAEHETTLTSLHNLGEALMAQEKMVEARDTLHSMRPVVERQFHPETDLALKWSGSLAYIYRRTGDYTRAEEIHRKILEIEERTLGADHPDTLKSLIDLGAMLAGQQRIEESENIYQEVLKRSRERWGDHHQITLEAMHRVAYTQREQEKFSEAEEMLRQALSIKTETLGTENESTLASMITLAGLFDTQGRYYEAESLFRQAWGIRVGTSGKADPQTFKTMKKLTVCLKHQGKFEEAESLTRMALDIKIEVLGTHELSTWDSMIELAEFLRQQGKIAQAEGLLRQVVALWQHSPQTREMPSSVPDCAIELGNLLLLKGAISEAEAWCRWARSIYYTTYGGRSVHRLWTSFGLAGCLMARGEYVKALELLQPDLEFAQETLGRTHTTTVGLAELVDEVQSELDSQQPRRACGPRHDPQQGQLGASSALERSDRDLYRREQGWIGRSSANMQAPDAKARTSTRVDRASSK